MESSSGDAVTDNQLTPKATKLAAFPATPQSRGSTLRSRKRKRSEANLDEKVPGATSGLLLAIPGLCAVPSNHSSHVASLLISLRSLRMCLAQESLTTEIECRAWTALAEIGCKVIGAGWNTKEDYAWAQGLESEVETAIGKGLVIAQRTTSLSVYKQYLSILHSRLAHWQQNIKFSRSLIKRVSSSYTFPSSNNVFESPSAPSWLLYSAHLTSISHSLSLSPPDHYTAFNSLDDILSAAQNLNDPSIIILSHVLRLRTLVDSGMWDEVGKSVTLAEGALGLSYSSDEPTFTSFDAPFESAMAIHVLIMAVVYYTHVGIAQMSSKRLTHLHSLLDSDALCQFPTGVIEIKLSSGPPLSIKCTHPRVLLQLAYLVSSTSKRDAVGRKPKRKVFAAEGINIWEKEMKREITLNYWSDPSDAEELDERMVKIKADLWSELVSVTIMRSEFDEAENHLAALIAHTRTFQIFDSYAARISLHQAHFSHAIGDAIYARQCYVVATHLSAEGTYVNVSARAGHIALQIGTGVPISAIEGEIHVLVKSCQGMGGTLEAVGLVLRACISTEIMTAKTHLKAALDVASNSLDNHLRGLILALISALYLRTAETHARSMLNSCGQIAAGLGAIQKRDDKKDTTIGATDEPVGNAVLGLWVGQQFLDIYKRDGNQRNIAKQTETNARLASVVNGLARRHRL